MRFLSLVLPRARRDERARRAAFRHLVAQADTARDDGRHADAATLYAEAVALRPLRGDLHVQLGHMLKEAGDHRRARAAYDAAQRLLPDDADLALQRGHLLRRAGSPAEARDEYLAAQALSPGWAEPASHIAAIDRDAASAMIAVVDAGDVSDHAGGAAAASPTSHPAGLAPELAPRAAADRIRRYDPGVELRSFGQPEHGAWGDRRTLRGVAAIRGVCHSVESVPEVQLLLDGKAVCAGPVRGGDPLAPGEGRTRLRKFVFNLWHDFSAIPAGRYAAEIRCLDSAGGTLSLRDEVVVAPPLGERAYPASDGVVDGIDGAADEPAALERAIRSRPSVVRPAERRVFAEQPRNVLVLRTDQLDPADPDGHIDLGRFLMDRGAVAEAETAAREAIALAPLEGAAHLLLAEVLLRARRVDQALEAADVALRLLPGRAHFYRCLGIGLSIAHHLADAERYARQGMRMEPTVPDHRNLVAEVVEGQGRRAEAVALLEEGIALGYDNDQTYSLLGNFHMRDGALEEAERGFARGVELHGEARPDLHACLAQVRDMAFAVP